MNRAYVLYDALAALLAYPDADYHQRISACQCVLGEQHPDAIRLLNTFAEQVAPSSPQELEELYTRTFDLNPVCSLEVGWHLFGENYSRGEFLVTMRQELRRSGLPESTELPDHLTHVLSAMARMSPGHADRFTVTYLLPALDKMLKGLAGKESPYENVLEAIRQVLLSPYGAVLPG